VKPYVGGCASTRGISPGIFCKILDPPNAGEGSSPIRGRGDSQTGLVGKKNVVGISAEVRSLAVSLGRVDYKKQGLDRKKTSAVETASSTCQTQSISTHKALKGSKATETGWQKQSEKLFWAGKSGFAICQRKRKSGLELTRHPGKQGEGLLRTHLGCPTSKKIAGATELLGRERKGGEQMHNRKRKRYRLRKVRMEIGADCRCVGRTAGNT